MYHRPLGALLLAHFTLAHAQTFSGSGGAIPDDGTSIDFPLSVPGLVPGTLDTTFFGLERVCIDLEHTWIADLDLSIVAPDGTTALLVGGNGGDTDFYSNTCFTADATTPIVAGTTPYSGDYAPMSQMGVVNNGQDGNGTWKLHVLDTYPFADTGELFSWSITFGPAPATYTALHESTLPIVVITTDGTSIPNEPKVPGEMGIIWNGPGLVNHATDPFNDHSGRIGIELRGNSSLGFPKKSYGIELWDAFDNDTSAALLGMPPESDWVLRSSYSDKSLLNDPLTMHVHQRMGHWAPRWRHVELVLNGQYLGVYQFLEKIKRDAERVDIAKLLPTDIAGDELTGGYIVKIDWAQGSFTGGWSSPYPPPNAPGAETIDFFYDEPGTPVPQQEAYIQAFVDSFETALNGPDFRDPLLGYRPFIDVRSFADFLLLNELARNVDGYRLSTFLYKDKNSNGGALHMGPVWDFDLAWGNADYCRGNDLTGWMYEFNYDCPGGKMVPFWWSRMMQDTVFTDSLRCRWDALRAGPLSTDSLLAWCDSMHTVLQAPQARNFEVWPILGTWVWPNPWPVPATYSGEVDELKDWILLRAAWMDAHLPDQVNGCSTVGMRPTEALPDPLVFPVPFRGTLWVVLTLPVDEPVHATLLDAWGREVQLATLRGEGGAARRCAIPIDPALPEGAYVLRLRTNSRTWSRTVIKG